MIENDKMNESQNQGSVLTMERSLSGARQNIENTSLMSRPSSTLFLTKKKPPFNYRDYLNIKNFSAKT